MSEYDRPEPLRRGDLDAVGSLFGIRFTDGGSWGIAELYIEDDESYFLKATFDRSWLNDLIHVATTASALNPTVKVKGEATTPPPWAQRKRKRSRGRS
jgi:hypothetical protein